MDKTYNISVLAGMRRYCAPEQNSFLLGKGRYDFSSVLLTQPLKIRIQRR